MYNNVYTVSEIISNTDYLMFKKGIRPEWEDPRNKKGGKWVVTLPIEEDMEEECDHAWMLLLLHMIGGLFPEDCVELINGAILSIRDKHWRISLWCNDHRYQSCCHLIWLRKHNNWCNNIFHVLYAALALELLTHLVDLRQCVTDGWLC